jgi:hypothetical protein
MSACVPTLSEKNPRPMWVLLVLAMTLAPVVAVLLKSNPFGDLLDLLRTKVTSILMPTLLQHLPWPAELWEMGAHALIGLATHYLLLVMLMLLLLRFTRCGTWLAMNRLALVLLVSCAAGLALRMLVAILRRWPEGQFFRWERFFREWVDGPLLVCLFSGLAVLLLSTLWHRLLLPRPHWLRALAYCWEER